MRYRVGNVQSTDLGGTNGVGVGFNILNEHGAPIVSFAYLDPNDAEYARALIEGATANAALIAAAGR